MEELRNIQYGVYYVVFLSEYAAALGRVGQLGEGLAAIDEAINRSHRNSENWYLPELLSVKGELILLAGGPHALTEAKKTFRESLNLAQRQEALSWQLRAATSLARLPLPQSQKIEALELLRATYCRFEEGHTSADLVEAQRLLQEGN
jgi:predicted ATPase